VRKFGFDFLLSGLGNLETSIRIKLMIIFALVFGDVI